MATLKVRLKKSTIGSNKKQKATVESLGLKRIGDVAEHPDTPVTRGKINKVSHLVELCNI